MHTAYHYRKIVRIGNHLVYLSGVKTVNKEGLIGFVNIATCNFNPQTMTVYKDRWQIETMFKAMKTGGFNMKDTHLNDLGRLSKLLCIICITFALVYLSGWSL